MSTGTLIDLFYGVNLINLNRTKKMRVFFLIAIESLLASRKEKKN